MRQALPVILKMVTSKLLRPSLVTFWIFIQLGIGLTLSAYPKGEINNNYFYLEDISLTHDGFLIHHQSVSENYICNAIAGTITPVVNSICVEGSFATLEAVPDGNMVIPPGFSLTYFLTSGANSEILQINGSPQFTVSIEGVYTIHPFVFDPTTFDLNNIITGTTTAGEVNAQLEQGGGTICASLDLVGASILTEKAVGIVIFTTDENCDNGDGSASLAPVSSTFDWADGFSGSERFDLTDGVYLVTVTQSTGLGCTAVIDFEIFENCSCTSPPVVSNVVVVEATCGNTDGSATLQMSTGANYTYTWSPNVSNSNSATGLLSGIYNVTIADPNDPTCSTIESFVVENSNGPVATVTSSSAANCGVANGSITLSPSNYNYTWCDGGTGSSRNDLPAGTCFVNYVDPATGCNNIIEVFISEINNLNVQPTNITSPTCGQSDGSVTITTTGGSGNYSYLWEDGSASTSRFGLSSGTYIVTVTDNNATCSVVETFVLTDNVAGATVNISSNVTLSCAGDANGTVNYNVQLAPGFVQPSIEVINDASGNTVSNGTLSVGNYCIIVSDGNGCIAGEECFVVTEPSNIQVDVATTDETCTQLGSISISSSGGNGGFQYDWSDLTGSSNPQNRTNISAGTYNLTVRDANNCTVQINNIVVGLDCNTGPCTTPQLLSIIKTESSCGQSTGSATINVVTGNNNFVFSFSDGIANGNEVTGLAAGTYIVTITDINDPSCFVEEFFTIGNIDGPDVNIISTTPTSCNALNGGANLEPATFTYLWCDSGTGNIRNDLPGGICEVTVTDPATGCFNVVEIDIPIANLLTVNPIINQIPDCNVANGVVVLNINGGSNNYTFTWSDDPSINVGNRNNLPGGTYAVTVVDNGPNGCVGEATFTLLENTASTATITIQSTDNLISCPGESDGEVIYAVNPDPGFIQPVSEQIVDANGNVYTNGSLPVGSYCIEVTDGTGCLAASECFSISSPDPIIVDIATTPRTCTQPGTIFLQVSGGTGSYNFDWADIAGTNNPQDRTGLLAGDYSVLVSDANGCEVNLVNINIADECSCSATAGTLFIDMTPVVFDGINPVQISATPVIAPNVPPGFTVLYVLTSGPGLVIENASFVPSFTVTALGNYTIHTLVYDPATLDPANYTNGLDLNADLLQGGGTICAALDVTGAAVEVIPDGNCVTPVIENIVVIEATCGNTDGIATVNMAGLGMYNYQWSNGSTTSNINTGLAANCYTVTITDANNPTCFIVDSLIVGNADGPDMSVFSTTPTSCNANNGTAVLQPQTNLFDWRDGTSGAIRTDLLPGINVVTVTDPGTGCTNVFEVFIESVNDLNIQLSFTQQPDCNTSNGSVEAIVTGGSTNYTYLWSDSPGTNTSTISGLSSGIYGLTVVDNGPNACIDSVTFVLVDNVSGIANVSIVNNSIQEVCSGSNDTSVDFAVAFSPGFVQPPTERIVDENGNEFTNGQLPAGNYCIEVLDGNGCLAGASCFEVLPAPTLIVNIEVDPKTCVDNGAIRTKPFGGTGFYTYDWDDLPNMSDPQNRFDLDAGLYSVTVTDQNGCTAVADNILVQDTCTNCPTPSEEFLTLPINSTDSVEFVLETCFDSAQTVFVLLDGTTSGSSTFGSWVLGPNGTLIYTSNNIPEINADTICVIANYNILSDTTCIIVTITPECMGQDIIADSLINLTTSDCVAGVEYCLPLSATQIGNYTFTDNGNAYMPGMIGCDYDTVFFYSLIDFLTNAPSGPYELTNWDVESNSFSITSFETISELVDSMNVWDNIGNWTLSGTIITGGAPSVNYGTLTIEQIGTGFSAVLQPELDLVNPSGTLITVDTGFHELIITDLTTGCIDTVIIDVLCDDCVDLYTGPPVITAANCDTTASLCVDIPLNDLGPITVDGLPYSGSVEGCMFDTLANCYSYANLPGLGADGPYNLDIWEKSSGDIFNAQFDSIEALVVLLNGWDPTGNWTLDPVAMTICGGTNGVIYGNIGITQINSGAITVLNPTLDIFIFASAIQVDTGFHQVIINNIITGCTDTINIEIDCDLTPGIDTLVQVFVSETDTLCFDFMGDTITSVSNLCPELANGNVAGFAYIPGTSCVEYTGMVIGVDTFCMEFCFTNGTCTTYNVIVQVVPEVVSADTIQVDVLVNFTEQYCIDTSIFLAPIDTIYNYCDASSGMFSEVMLIEPNCIDITGNVIGGLDTACIVVCDTSGFCDTTIFLINVIPPSPEIVMEVIELGADSIYCVDTTELFGNIISIDNICPQLSGTYVDFTLDPNTFCVEYTGIDIGVDTACIVICDDLGICDTTTFIVEVVLPFDTLVAIDDDTITTTINPVTIDVLDNDIIGGDTLIFGIIDGVDHGTLVINIDGTVTYLAEPGFCGDVDSFTYFISNGVLTDTATVTIEVLCDDLKVFDGFSPNGDGINDLLYIQGIDNFPNNEVFIFNRWGNEVFRQSGYSNDERWDATFNGKDLPDGTYFYIIEDGEGQKYTGWVHIRR